MLDTRAPDSNGLTVNVENRIATLTIRRPAVCNAIDVAVIRAIHGALDKIQMGECKTRVVVITGSDGVFCSGLDLHSCDLRTSKTWQIAHAQMRRYMDPLIFRLSTFRLPIIAAVNGAAIGAGMSLALASDILIASEAAYFLASYVRLGFVPDAGVTFHLARRIGTGRALSTLLLGEKLAASTALKWGLAYSIVPPGDLSVRAQEIAERLAAGPCTVLSQIRGLMLSTFEHSLSEQLRAERSAQAVALRSRDCVEGVGAFFDKRMPHFAEN